MNVNRGMVVNVFALVALVIFIIGAVLYHGEFRLLFAGLAAFVLAHFAF